MAAAATCFVVQLAAFPHIVAVLAVVVVLALRAVVPSRYVQETQRRGKPNRPFEAAGTRHCSQLRMR